MKGCRANFIEVEDDFLQDDPLVIRDIGPWDKHPSVTNDAEAVIETLVNNGHLPEGRRLFCYDTEGQLDELLVKAGKFAGFAPGPRPGIRKCRICGCTEDHACEGGCYWVGPDLCSACEEKMFAPKEGKA